jgi:aminoglycoside phosphotransferase (APT) family kinase protein
MNKDAELRRALAGFAAGRAVLAAQPTITALSGGQTNRTVRVEAPGIDWVLRVSRGRDERLHIDREHEARVLAQVAEAGFAPAIVHLAPGEGVLVTQYVAGGPWTRAAARTVAAAAVIGARLRALHALPLPAGLPVLDLHDVLLHYLELSPPRVSFVPRATLAATIRHCIVSYRPARAVLCHHDLHHLNILDGEPPRFVDWEYAAPGDGAVDLAAYAQYHDLEQAARTALLAAYGASPPLSPSSFADTCLLFDCLHALWLDAADAWDSVDAPRRTALCARLLDADPPAPVSE